MTRDPTQISENARPSADRARDRLNGMVATRVGLLATFMGICEVKDDNIAQAMQQAQTGKVDQWAFYQARNLREEIAQATAATLGVGAASAETGSPAAAMLNRQVELAERESAKKSEAQQKAKDSQDTYDALNRHDDQFDLSDALPDIAIQLLAVTALTRKRRLSWVAWVPTFFGVLIGLCGLLAWNLHPDLFTSLLG